MGSRVSWILTVILLAAVTPLSATPIVTGQLLYNTSPPSSLAAGAFESATSFSLIQEVAPITLVSPVSGGVIGGTIPAGTLVTMYIVHSDSIGSTTTVYSGGVTFDGPILGLYIGSAALDAIDPLATALGSPIATYPTGLTTRGLETGQGLGDSLSLSNANQTLAMTFTTGPDVDELRVIVAAPVPEPASGILFGAGLAALLGGRKLWASLRQSRK